MEGRGKRLKGGNMGHHARGKRKSILSYVGLVLGLAIGTAIVAAALLVVSADLAVAAPTGWEATQLTTDSQPNYAANTDGKWRGSACSCT
jgi:hypothetical protein